MSYFEAFVVFKMFAPQAMEEQLNFIVKSMDIMNSQLMQK